MRGMAKECWLWLTGEYLAMIDRIILAMIDTIDRRILAMMTHMEWLKNIDCDSWNTDYD